MNEMSEQNNIVLSHPDELMEFLWIKPKISGINVDIFVDDSKSYKRNNRPLLLFARNGYDKSVGDFIPFSISEHPSVLNDEIEFNISYDDIFLIQDFIQVNRQLICNLADYTISQREFFDNVVKV